MKKVEYNGTTYFIDRDLIGTPELRMAITDILASKLEGMELYLYGYKNILVHSNDKNEYRIYNSRSSNKKEDRRFTYKPYYTSVERAMIERRITNE